MTKENYKTSIKAALDAAKLELNDLLEKQTELEKQIAQMRQTVGSLSQIWEELSPPPSNKRNQPSADDPLFMEAWGLTDSIREVLKAADERLIATQVRDGLIRLNHDVSNYKNLMAAIHTTLSRLCQKGELEETAVDGKSAYRYLSLRERQQRGLIKESRKQTGKK
jgi:hypothetical protein